MGKRLAKWRISLSLTQQQLAERLEMTLKTYARSETEERAMDAGEMAKLAEIGAPLNWLLTGHGEMHLVPESTAVPAVPGEEIGPGKRILRSLPQYPIPQELQEILDFIAAALKLGPRNYPVARFNVVHLASLIDEIMERSEQDKRSDPTKTAAS